MSFLSSQDELIFSMHVGGMLLDEIAAKLHTPVGRVIHVLNRAYNAQAGWFGLGDPRNTFRWRPCMTIEEFRQGLKELVADAELPVGDLIEALEQQCVELRVAEMKGTLASPSQIEGM